MIEEEAIVVKNAVKNYGSDTPVLKDLNMTVSKSSIYGLLGASGCGKTTLLSCIVGIKHVDKGEVWVLGGKPGSQGSGIPGPRVGYMPQEISLIGEFSRSDALYYFGRINGLESDEIETRQKFLAELLQLPPREHLVRNMSGGQKRRVSLAAALIHQPELLILDEPTVGLDPILRESIWAYLIKITQEDGITVVITTHYIEEAKDANKIGLMREGKLLAESSPLQLLERFQCTSLEDAFLTVSQMQHNNMAITNISTIHRSNVEDSEEPEILCQNRHKQKKHETVRFKRNPRYKVSRLKKFKALLEKNSIQFLRYREGIAFAVLFPILQVCTFFIGIGMEPTGLKIGVVNDEANNCDYGSNFGNIIYDEKEFVYHFDNLSCRFLQDFGNSIAKKVYYDDISDAIAAIHTGELIGVMYFSQNFSEALQRRIEEFTALKDEDILASQIQFFLDMGDMQVGLHIRKKLFERFFEIYGNVMKECNISAKFADQPVRFEQPVYGSENLNFAVFMAPGYILTLVFYLANTISTSIIITDREAGVWNRSLVQGVTTTEIMFTHVLTQTVIIIIHTIMTLCLCFPIWGLKCQGPMFVVIWLVLLSGFCGLIYGFLISVMCTNHTMAHYASTGSFFPLILLSGCIWPVETMPKLLRWISLALPMTVPSISLRAIMEKGYSIEKPEVYNGFLIIAGWAVFFLSICSVNLRIKSK